MKDIDRPLARRSLLKTAGLGVGFGLAAGAAVFPLSLIRHQRTPRVCGCGMLFTSLPAATAE